MRDMGDIASKEEIYQKGEDLTVEDIVLDKIWTVFNNSQETELMLSLDEMDEIIEILKKYKSE